MPFAGLRSPRALTPASARIRNLIRQALQVTRVRWTAFAARESERSTSIRKEYLLVVSVVVITHQLPETFNISDFLMITLENLRPRKNGQILEIR